MHTTESRSERAIERLRSELAAVLSGQAETSSSRIRRRVAGCLNQIAADDPALEDELRRRASTVERLTGVDTAFHRARTRCEFLRGIVQELPGRLAALDEKEAKHWQEQNGLPRHEAQGEVRSYEVLMRLPLRVVKMLDDKPVGEGERAPYNQNELEGLATGLEKLLRIEFGFSDTQRAALAQWREEILSVVHNAEDAHAEGCFHLLIIWLAESTLSSDTAWAAQADRIVSNRDCVREMYGAACELGSVSTASGGAQGDGEEYLPVTALARKFGVEPEPLRKRLDRWRQNNKAGPGWLENEGRSHKSAKWLYQVKVVQPIAAELRRE